MFDLGRFIEDCRAAGRKDSPHMAIREVLARANSDRAAIITALGEPTRPAQTTLYHSDKLTVLHVVWRKYMVTMPHDHRMWAVIGVYSGRENNIFWRRVPGREDGLIEAVSAKSLGEGCAELLDRDVIHSVTNPLDRLTAALHVYGGDFFGTGRSEWDRETLLERPYDFELRRRLMEAAPQTSRC
jgi:predicted metal-dependent enzyme (double-stranded beta helix superfamily)